ncbi:MAG: ethanolamine ammonia-lyase subunit EutC [Spirochaetaceae bacterium]|nr:MAG: ethanolamine ammonia-lyase subunit EutC [Spirochaetaceae bacterium]
MDNEIQDIINAVLDEIRKQQRDRAQRGERQPQEKSRIAQQTPQDVPAQPQPQSGEPQPPPLSQPSPRRGQPSGGVQPSPRRGQPSGGVQPSGGGDELIIDLEDPATSEARTRPGVDNPYDPDGLRNLMAATTARIGVGRAGPRPRTAALLRFQADHGVTQDAIYSEVDQEVLDRCKLFTVQSQVEDRGTYLLRPDLGRRLSPEARSLIERQCTAKPQVQIVVGDGLSAAAINNNLESILPVIMQGLASAGIAVGTPFFVRFCRVGIINEINDIIGAEVVILLIGERPGLGVADALSAYMGYQPARGKTDGDRDAFCMITDNGGTNPLEAGAYIVEQARKYLKHRASGMELRMKMAREDGKGGMNDGHS